LLIELLAAHEEMIDQLTARPSFNIDLIAERLVGATEWLPQ
jgi:hypothetical protein